MGFKSLDMMNLTEQMNAYAESILGYSAEFATRDDKYWHERNHGVIVLGGFIEWNDTPEAWAGPWDKNHVLVKVVDFTHTLNLHSETVVKALRRDYEKYSMYNFPHRFHNAIYNNPDSPGRSQLTYQERIEMLNDLTLSEAEAYDKTQARFETDDFKIGPVPTKEDPFKIALYGTDDHDTALVVPTLKVAQSIVDMLCENPSFKLLEEYGFSPH